MTELPNTVAAQAQLHAAMRRSTDPRWVERQLSPPIIVVKPSRIGWWAIVAVVVVSIVLAGIGIARASEPPRDWVVFNLSAGSPWINPKTGLPATSTGATACSMALREVSTAVPSGTRLSCIRK